MSMTTTTNARPSAPRQGGGSWSARAVLVTASVAGLAGVVAWDARVAGGILLGGLTVDVYRTFCGGGGAK